MKPHWGLLLGCALSACGDSGLLEATVGGPDSRVMLEDHGRAISVQRGGDTLLRLPADAFMLAVADRRLDSQSYDPYWIAKGSAPQPEWLAPDSSSLAQDDPQSATITLRYPGGHEASVVLRADAAGRFSARWSATAGGGRVVTLFKLRARASATEGFYGTGERPDHVEQRGRLRPMQIELDGELESKNDEGHVPVPLLVGTRGWGLFVESRRVGAFDIARSEADLIETSFAAGDEGLTVHLFTAPSALDVYKHYYDLTGTPRLPAPWALGPMVWRNENKDQAQLLDDLKQLRTRDLATTALWIDRPYATRVNSFDFDAAKFPDAPAMIAAVHEAGFRLALWHTPYLEDGAPLAQQAAAQGWFPPVTSLLLNQWSKPIDFTNPAARAAWRTQIERYTSMGIEGFKLDYGEDIVPSVPPVGRSPWKFFDGSDERTMHHGYTVLYHRAYAETLSGDGGFLLCRAARWGDQVNASIIWPGDMDASFTKHREMVNNVVGVGGLPATIIMGNTLSASGFPFFGADTGGYRHSPPDRELWIRWVEQTALSTVMQVGDASSQMPWEYNADNGRDDAALDIYRTFARLHLRLWPYLWTHAKKLESTGRPIQRPLGLAFPEQGTHPDDVYLLGDDLLVAPVVERGATTRQVALPAGEWIDWWSGTRHSGTVTAAAPLDRIPLYLRKGGIVPMLRPTIDTLSATGRPAEIDSFASDPGPLWARAVLGDGDFTVYDGTRIKMSASGRIEITPGNVFATGVVLELLAQGAPASITLDGAAHTDFTAGATLIVRVPAGAHVIQIN